MEDKDILEQAMNHLKYSIKGEQSKFARTLINPREPEKSYSQDTISKILNGHLDISKQLAIAINDKHHISLKFLLTGEGPIEEGKDERLDAKIQELEALP